MSRFRFQNINKVSRYLLYAIGEIILVVIGILIAVEFNNRNEQRRDRAQEQEILLQLRREYNVNLLQLGEKIQMRNKIINASLRILESVDDASSSDVDTIVSRFVWLLRDPTFDPIKNDIIGTSNMRLILSDSLRSLLTNWESEVYQLQEVELQWQKVRTETIIPFTIESGIARSLHNELWKDGHVPIGALDKQTPKTFKLGPSKTKLDIHMILKGSGRIEGIASTAITMNQICNMQSAALQSRIRTIINLLNREIGKGR
jgi:hypothetical protein